MFGRPLLNGAGEEEWREHDFDFFAGKKRFFFRFFFAARSSSTEMFQFIDLSTSRKWGKIAEQFIVFAS